MKMLLMSRRPTNEKIRESLREMLSVEPSSIKMAVVPTASTLHGDDGWIDREMLEHKESFGFGSVVRCDLDGTNPEEAIARILESDVLEMWGGNTGYLLDWVKRSGLADRLVSGIQDVVYLGESAGSMILGPTIDYVDTFFPGEGTVDQSGLNLVPFVVIPHLNEERFVRVRAPEVSKFAETVAYPVYALDNQCAIQVDGSEVSVVGGGEYMALNI